jgi:hypothetical protein
MMAARMRKASPAIGAHRLTGNALRRAAPLTTPVPVRGPAAKPGMR